MKGWFQLATLEKHLVDPMSSNPDEDCEDE